MAGANPVNGLEIPNGKVGFKELVVKVTASLTNPETTESEDESVIAAVATRNEAALTQSLASLYESQPAGHKKVILTIDPTDLVRVCKTNTDGNDADDVLDLYQVTAGDAITFELALDSNGATHEWAGNTFYASVVGTDNPENATTFAGSKIVASVALDHE